MTNSRLTDPEVLEWRYPCCWRSSRSGDGSGGAGRWRGGDGAVRRIRFLEPMTVRTLSGHRRVPPYGMAGGAPGALGANRVERADGTRHAARRQRLRRTSAPATYWSSKPPAAGATAHRRPTPIKQEKRSMIFGRSERGKPPVEPVTLKILVAGGFGVGKTTLVGAVSEIRPLRTEELLTEAGRPVDDIERRGGQAHHHRGHGLRPDHAPRGPGAVPVRHPRPGPLLVPVGRAGHGRPRRGRARRHPPPGGLLRRRSTTSSAAPSPSWSPSTASTAPHRYPADEVRQALDLDPDVPVVLCDARDRESVKEVLVGVVQHAMATGGRPPRDRHDLTP